MKKRTLILAICILTLNVVQAAEKAPQVVVNLASTVLVNYGTDPVIVAAVKAEKLVLLTNVHGIIKNFEDYLRHANFLQSRDFLWDNAEYGAQAVVMHHYTAPKPPKFLNFIGEIKLQFVLEQLFLIFRENFSDNLPGVLRREFLTLQFF